MNRKYRLLLKLQLLSLFGINKVLHTRDKKEKNKHVFMGIAWVIAIFTLIGYSSFFSYGLAKLGIAHVMPIVMLTFCSIITLILTFIKSSVLFGARDYDMVMSLPIKGKTVILSRLTMIYLANLILSLITIAPSVVIYSIFVSASAEKIIMLVLMPFLSPIVPMILAMSIGVVIIAISARFKYKSAVNLVLGLASVLSSVILSMSMSSVDDKVILDFGLAIQQSVSKIYPLAGLYGSAVQNGDWMSFLLFILISAGIGVLFIQVLSAYYEKINTALSSYHKKGNYKVGGLKAKSAFMALYQREMRRLLSCTVYALNTLTGAVLFVVAGIALLIANPANILEALELNFLLDNYIHLLPILISFFVCISPLTSCSLSLEGKNRWIICSAPISHRVIFDAKIAVSLTFLIPVSIIGAACFSIALNTKVAMTTLMFIMPIIYSLFTSVAGMYINTKFPKYDWTSEYYAVKSSASVIITLLAGIAAIIAPILLSILTPLPGTSIVLASAAIILAVTAIIYNGLCKTKLYAW